MEAFKNSHKVRQAMVGLTHEEQQFVLAGATYIEVMRRVEQVKKQRPNAHDKCHGHEVN